VLEEEVVFAAEEDQAVGVVVPAAARREVDLPAERLGVERIADARLDEGVGLPDGLERRGILRELVDDDRQRLPPPRRDVHRGPPVGAAVGELHVVADHRLAVDQERHHALRRAVPDRDLQVAAVGHDVAAHVLPRPPGADVGLHDVIDVDVAPPAGRRVDDP